MDLGTVCLRVYIPSIASIPWLTSLHCQCGLVTTCKQSVLGYNNTRWSKLSNLPTFYQVYNIKAINILLLFLQFQCRSWNSNLWIVLLPFTKYTPSMKVLVVWLLIFTSEESFIRYAIFSLVVLFQFLKLFWNLYNILLTLYFMSLDD